MMIHGLGKRTARFWVACLIAGALAILLTVIPPWRAAGVSAESAATATPLSIGLNYPNEGETFYFGAKSFLYSIPVKGWVHSQQFPPELVKVDVQVFQGEQLVIGNSLQAKEDGTFQMYATVNPSAFQEDFTHWQTSCQDECHFNTDFILPAGQQELRITATDPSGATASIVKRITVDRSGVAEVPVQVAVEGQDRGVANLPIQASTRIYLWRTRIANAITDDRSVAVMKLEALSEAPTEYVIHAQPVILDGSYYEETAPVSITLPPGATSMPPVTLTLRAMSGEIHGVILGQEPDSLPLRLLHLPEGSRQVVNLDGEGGFDATALPLGKYLLGYDPQELAALGYRADAKTLDLAQTMHARVEVAVKQLDHPAASMQVREKGGEMLPFNWATSEHQERVAQSWPAKGSLSLSGLAEETTLVIGAPGYYSQAHRFSPEGFGPQDDIELVRRPDTRSVPWGAGEVVVPASTLYKNDGGALSLESGAIWGYNQSVQPITIRIGKTHFTSSSGRFALEYDVAARKVWLFVSEGEMRVESPGQLQPVGVQANQMLSLHGDELPIPVPSEPLLYLTGHSYKDQSLEPVWEPGLQARLRDSVARLSLRSAQILTYITYAGLFLFLILFPLAALVHHLRGK